MAPVTRNRFAHLAVLFAALASAQLYAADPPAVALPLTSFEVLGLVQQGIGDEAVIARLRETRSMFHLSADEVRMLKALGVSDRVLAAMTGDAPRPMPPVVQAAAIAPAPAALAGTWVRKLNGMQVVLKFTDKRIFATLNVAYVVDGIKDEARMTFRANADYAVGPDGTVFGVVTGTDYTPPKGDAGTAAVKELASLNGMPFCFRFRIDDRVLSVRDLRCGSPGEGPDAAMVLGRYTRTDKEPTPPKAGRKPTVYPADPVTRMNQLINQSEDIRQIGEPAPAPRPVTPERLHGGIIK